MCNRIKRVMSENRKIFSVCVFCRGALQAALIGDLDSLGGEAPPLPLLCVAFRERWFLERSRESSLLVRWLRFLTVFLPLGCRPEAQLSITCAVAKPG